VLNVVNQLIQIIDKHIAWLYLACLVGILLYVNSYIQARREREFTSFPIEKEIAQHRQGRAMTGVGIMLAVAAVLTGLKYYILPTVDLSEFAQPTPTETLPIPSVVAMVTAAPTADATSAPTTSARPTAAPSPTSAPTPTASEPTTTPPPAPAPCPDENTRIISPGMNAVVSGWVTISGTANHAQFQFYKVEYGIGENPSTWNSVGDLHHSPVVGGQLAGIDTSALPNGAAWFRLTVVDQTGNFPAPCSVRVVISN